MPVERINSIKLLNQRTTLPKNKQQSEFSAQDIEYSPSFLGQDKIYADQIQRLKLESQLYPNDIEYKKQLLVGAGKNPEDYHKIRSIVGAQEINEIFSEFSCRPEVYTVGDDYENVNDRIFRANTHMHTTASDGYLSIQELLDKAASYADEAAKNPANKKEPFVIAITDHDTTESCKEAVDIISSDPLKYKNLRVILGIEMTTFNDIAPKIVNKPTNVHTLAYGINPFEEKFGNFIEKTKEDKYDVQKKMINSANETYKNFYNTDEDLFDLEEARSLYSPLKKDILGIYNYMNAYIHTKSVVKNIVLKSPELIEVLNENILPQDAEGLMQELIKFQYGVNHGNAYSSAHKIIPAYFEEKAGVNPCAVEQIIKDRLEEEENKEFTNLLKDSNESFLRTWTPKYDYAPTMKDLYGAFENQDNVLIGIAHPLDTVENIKDEELKYEFLEDLYRDFKENCGEKAAFSEAYYQSYSGTSQELDENPKTAEFFDEIGEELNLYKTGGIDSHRKNIFRRYWD